MPDDKTFEATKHGHPPGPDVSDGVRQGGTRPEHVDPGGDDPAQADHSPHDDGKGDPRAARQASDPATGVAALNRGNARRDEAAERTERRESIEAKDRAAGKT